MSRQQSSSVATSGRSVSRFSRPTAPFESLPLERPPIVLEWGSDVVRVGYSGRVRPQYVQPWQSDCCPLMEQEWYAEIASIVSKMWDRLFLSSNSSRRVVCVHPPMMPRAWTRAIMKVLTNQGVPGVFFVGVMDTIPYALGWKRGVVVHLGRTEAFVVAHVDGRTLNESLQVVPCGYEAIIDGKDPSDVTWDDKMEWCWLDENNPNSLIFALLKSLETVPVDSRSDVVANITFTSETVFGVSDLNQRLGQRLVSLIKPEPDGKLSSIGASPEGLTMTPTQWTSLVSLLSQASVVSTAPFRPDALSWIGASMWSSVWHRERGQFKWIEL